MRREEKMKNVKSFAILISSIILLSISMLSFYTYADFDENMKIFNELKPSEFINGNKKINSRNFKFFNNNKIAKSKSNININDSINL